MPPIQQYYEEIELMHQEGHSCREIGGKFGVQKNRAKNICEGQDAKLRKNRNICQNDAEGQQSKCQLHCQR